MSVLPKEGDKRWIPPCRGIFRLDVDVSIHANGNLVGAGFLVRDHERTVLAAAARRIGRTETTLMGELHSILLGVGFCMEQDFCPLEVFTDSLLAVHVLSEKTRGIDSLCDDLYDAFISAKEKIVLDFKHVRREANRAAHFLANLAVCVPDAMIWRSDFPSSLLDIVHRDLN
ncbi:uncharacterized protein LOC131009939 [Salvia miltiorrhiza]|uniref:uncharacterized protein LOC131009939 n=1 Tax=Salvia miltiorrhiza TaxID=226208 RepID=UPI0025AC9020|nr:uncharacterized protein LOC131009939 [Salvia miltiorrhiza]